jgi:aryl-alcohol dehydrogenase-like predicted oxidoreductase
MSSKLPTRQLGRNGPQVPALGFGALGLSTFYGKRQPDEERFEFLDRAYELGARNWDSADVYGDNEDLIGEWFRRTGKRDDVSSNQIKLFPRSMKIRSLTPHFPS